VKYNYRIVLNIFDHNRWRTRNISVWKYIELLPINDLSNKVSLGEGGTGLYHCDRLGKSLGLKNLYVKNEGENPTGSFKDRGMTIGISRAVEIGVKKVACASTGNTSASLAAYAAKAGLECNIYVPSGKVASGKLAQAIIHGAKITQVEGYFDDALNIVINLTKSSSDLYLLNSINPYRLEGQKTIAYEIWEQLNESIPERLILPVGNAGNISAIWKGFIELNKLGLISNFPKMIGVQAKGSAPIAEAFIKGADKIEPISNPETIATAIRIGAPVNWKRALRAARESNGSIDVVTDNEILKAQRSLAKYEGLFVEPASASSIAALKKLVDQGSIDRDDKIVCIATGHGLKDPEVVRKSFLKIPQSTM
jgi:threonine synthase